MSIIDKVFKLYKRSSKVVLSAIDQDGYPYTKVVLNVKHKNNINEMYFTTNTSSTFVNLINLNNKTSIYFYNQFLFKGCYMKGEICVCNDLEIKKKYWRNAYKNAYPQKSYKDPDFCVLKFIPISGNYYFMYKKTNFNINN